MILNFENASLLSYSRDSRFFGDIFRYGVEKQISIRGNILNLTNTNGASGILSGISGFVQDKNDYSEIQLCGESFGSGRINSISFGASNHVRMSEYNASITVYETGNLFNLTGAYYSGVNKILSDNKIHLIDNFSENFSFSVSEVGAYTARQNINIKYSSGSGGLNPIQYAQTLASGLMSQPVEFVFINNEYSGKLTGNLKSYFSENYNEITNECSFSREINTLRPSGFYSINLTHNCQTNEVGITNVSENAEIQGLVDDVYLSAQSGYQIEHPRAFERCSGIFEFYRGANSDNLSNSAITFGSNFNIFDGTISYNKTFTNDPSLKDRYKWIYTHKIDKSLEGVINTSEDGTIVGFGRPFVDKFPNAEYGFSIVESGIPSRVSGFYAFATNNSKPLKLITKRKNASEFRGEIVYSQEFTDDLTAQNACDMNLVEFSFQDSPPIHIVNRYNIFGVKELAQPAGNTTIGVRNGKINIQGSPDKVLTSYLDCAKGIINAHVPTGGDVYISECDYSWDKNNNKVGVNVSWNFFGPRNQDDWIL